MQSRWTRLLPVMMIAYIIAFMDRTNIGFAIPTMGKDLQLSPSVLGFASGVLFLGYGVTQTARRLDRRPWARQGANRPGCWSCGAAPRSCRPSSKPGRS